MRFSAFFAVPVLLTLAAPAFASTMILPVQGTNLEPGEIDAISQMIASAYQVESKDTAIQPPESQKAVDEAGGYPQAAQKLGAKEYVYVTAVRLDQRIVLNATRYSADGKYIYSAKMSASSLDDMEPVSERLSKALIHQESTLDARTADNVTRTEGQTPIRANGEKVAGLKASFIYPVGWNEKVATQMSGAFDLRIENGEHFIELGIGLTFAAPDQRFSYGGIWTDIGMDFYLTGGNTSPYLGGGLMPRIMSDSGQSLANLAPYLQGGVMFFRDSKTRVYSDFRVAQNLLPITFGGDTIYNDVTGTYVAPRRNLYPTELTFNVGIGF